MANYPLQNPPYMPQPGGRLPSAPGGPLPPGGPPHLGGLPPPGGPPHLGGPPPPRTSVPPYPTAPPFPPTAPTTGTPGSENPKQKKNRRGRSPSSSSEDDDRCPPCPPATQIFINSAGNACNAPPQQCSNYGDGPELVCEKCNCPKKPEWCQTLQGGMDGFNTCVQRCLGGQGGRSDEQAQVMCQTSQLCNRCLKMWKKKNQKVKKACVCGFCGKECNKNKKGEESTVKGTIPATQQFLLFMQGYGLAAALIKDRYRRADEIMEKQMGGKPYPPKPNPANESGVLPDEIPPTGTAPRPDPAPSRGAKRVIEREPTIVPNSSDRQAGYRSRRPNSVTTKSPPTPETPTGPSTPPDDAPGRRGKRVTKTITTTTRRRTRRSHESQSGDYGTTTVTPTKPATDGPRVGAR